MPRRKIGDLDRKRATAHHEAGHAVMYIHQGRPFRHVTIKSEHEHDAAGYVLGYSRRRRWRLQDQGFIDVAALLCAVSGVLAQRIHSGRMDHLGASFDYRTAIDIARGVGEDGCGGSEHARRTRTQPASSLSIMYRPVRFASPATATPLLAAPCTRAW
jgi:ATP-dependent Zn protease